MDGKEKCAREKKKIAQFGEKCSNEHMHFHFQIRPVGQAEQGFELSCEGIFPNAVHHPRLIQAVIHAVQIGSHLNGDIRVYDCTGELAEVLPLRLDDVCDQLQSEACAA